MNLKNLDCAQLDALRQKLNVVVRVADDLMSHDLEPSVDLTASGTVLRVPSIFPVENDHDDAPAFEVPGAVSGALESMSSRPQAPGIVSRSDPDASTVAPPSPCQSFAEPAITKVTGPFSDDELARLHDLHDAGRSNAEIAEDLNRALNAIGLAVGRYKKSKARAATDARLAAPIPGLSVAAKIAPENTGTRRDEVPPQCGASASGAALGEQMGAVARGVSGVVWSILMDVGSLKSPPPWTPDLDLEICEKLFTGRRLPEIAIDFEVEANEIKRRFALLTASIRNSSGGLSVDGQAHLLTALRHRLAVSRAEAAAG